MRHLGLIGALCCALLLPPAAHAATPPANVTPPPPTNTPLATPAGMLTGVEVMSATVMQEGQSSFSGLAIRARFQPPQVMKQIEVMPTLEWWRNSNTIKPFGISTTRKDATLGVDARWNFSTGTFKPYIGAGYGLHFLSESFTSPTLNDSKSLTKGGLAVLGGVAFALSGKFDNFLDVKYHHVTDYRQLKINWGISYNL
jgi:opacity protein-like surface antigen